MDKAIPLVVKFSGEGKYQRLLAGSPQTKGLKSGFVNLRPGEEIGIHSTEDREEAIIILNGKAVVYYENDNQLEVEANSVVYMPPNTKHNVKNAGQDLLSYIFVVTPVK